MQATEVAAWLGSRPYLQQELLYQEVKKLPRFTSNRKRLENLKALGKEGEHLEAKGEPVGPQSLPQTSFLST